MVLLQSRPAHVPVLVLPFCTCFWWLSRQAHPHVAHIVQSGVNWCVVRVLLPAKLRTAPCCSVLNAQCPVPSASPSGVHSTVTLSLPRSMSSPHSRQPPTHHPLTQPTSQQPALEVEPPPPPRPGREHTTFVHFPFVSPPYP